MAEWKIAAVQMDCHLGEREHNLRAVRTRLTEAVASGARLAAAARRRWPALPSASVGACPSGTEGAVPCLNHGSSGKEILAMGHPRFRPKPPQVARGFERSHPRR